MFPFAWLIGLVLPACAATGAGGLPVPPPMDMARLERPATPNTALAASPIAGPAGDVPWAAMPPDLVTPVYQVPATRLFAAIQAVAEAQPRTFVAATYPDRLQVHWVVRSAVFNFPDLVTAQIAADGAGGSTLVLYSRSVYGRSDLGVNRARLGAWLAALATLLTPTTER